MWGVGGCFVGRWVFVGGWVFGVLCGRMGALWEDVLCRRVGVWGGVLCRRVGVWGGRVGAL